MSLWFVEIWFDEVWTPLGRGCQNRTEAEWLLAGWKQQMQCYGESHFRVMEHQVAEPPPEEVVVTPW